MVSHQQKLRCTQYLAERLEDSGLYQILSRDERQVNLREKPETRERLEPREQSGTQPRTIRVLISNFETIGVFEVTSRVNRQSGVYVAPVLYKDGKTAFVRMVERNSSWRTEKSLKQYTPQEINRMLHLRGIEKAVMAEFGDELMYYQPETEQLEESLRTFHLEPVELDYSHIDRDHPSYGFVKDRESIDYKLPKEIGELIVGPAKFIYTPRRFMAWIVAAQRREPADRN